MAQPAVTSYVEFGLQSTSPGPFRSTQGYMRLFLLEADDPSRIESLVERTLTGPARGAIAFRPLGRHVLLAIGESSVWSRAAGWTGCGSVREALASFWVPVWRGRPTPAGFEAERLCMCVPHILVNNPISHAAGREIYGFPKALGQFDPPSDFLPRRVVVSGFGGNFDPHSRASWVPVVEVAPVAAEAQPASLVDGSTPLMEELMRELLGSVSGDPEAPAERRAGLRVLPEAIREARAGIMRQVFLKQFRDAEHQQGACYQAVVEAIARTTHVKWRLSTADWRVTLHPVDSHPIGEELGVRSQRAKWSAELREYEFEVDAGKVIAP